MYINLIGTKHIITNLTDIYDIITDCFVLETKNTYYIHTSGSPKYRTYERKAQYYSKIKENNGNQIIKSVESLLFLSTEPSFII